MSYESFRSAFEAALRDSGLPVFGVRGEELLDLRSMDRIYRIRVEPIGGQDAEPFLVTALLSWRWTALDTARTITVEEDVLTEMLGRDDAAGLRTEKPWIRVDIELKATSPYGKPRPMPPPTALRDWTREAMTRLEEIEPLTPEERVREESGRLAVLAWQQVEPRVHVVCGPAGNLMLDAVEISAWQAIESPRALDDPNQPPDAGPEEQLAEMFGRARAALSAWMQALDHLRGEP
jgi:hypothetical protein